MEFYAKATRQWIKYHGMRFTTSECGLHQQNGMVENAVRYVKQRARTLLIGARLPQRLWPQAVAMATTAQRATVLGMEARLAAPFGAKVLVRRREYGGTAEPGKPDDRMIWLQGGWKAATWDFLKQFDGDMWFTYPMMMGRSLFTRSKFEWVLRIHPHLKRM